MSRKTPSSDKNTSFLKEIRNEFSGTFSKEEARVSTLLNSYPREILIAMVVLMVLSSLVTFVLNPLKNDRAHPEEFFNDAAKEIGQEVSGEISTLLDLGVRVKRISLLKAEVERIIQLEELSQGDSVFLEKAIQELEFFNNQNKEER